LTRFRWSRTASGWACALRRRVPPFCRKNSFTVTIDLQDGLGTADVYTCDLSHGLCQELMPTTVPDGRAVKGGKKILWIVPESLAIEPLVADIGRTFTLESESKGKSVATWYDTFDWRLYRRNLHLYADLSGWHLVRSDTGDPVAWLQGISPEEVEFVRHFPASRIRSVLEPILAVRRLLPLFTEETTMHAYRILNTDNKTVARLLFEEHHYQGSGSGLRTVSLHGVRGYDSAFRRMSRFIDGREWEIRSTALLFSAREQGRGAGFLLTTVPGSVSICGRRCRSGRR
jgi:hypothetical protein